jgi:hypothetical protein
MVKAMFRKTNYVPLGILLIIFALTACRGTDLTKGSSLTAVPDSTLLISPPISTPSSSPSPTPSSSPIASDENSAREDDSIRAIGTHPDGRLLVRPASKASVAPLGAPSCIGQETDLNWSGVYEAVWESKADGTASIVMTFPNDFGIVQPDETPVKMQEFTMGNTAVFAYIPRYTDCHGLETYFFGVSEGKAFPISLELKPDQIWTNISQLPHRPFQVANGELILTGGYGAGQDFIAVYHFRYDPKKHAMILHSTDQVNPNDINNPSAQQPIILDKDLDGDGKPEHLALSGTGYPESPFIFTVNSRVQQAITAISSYELKGAFSVVDLKVPDQTDCLLFQ